MPLCTLSASASSCSNRRRSTAAASSLPTLLAPGLRPGLEGTPSFGLHPQHATQRTLWWPRTVHLPRATTHLVLLFPQLACVALQHPTQDASPLLLLHQVSEQAGRLLLRQRRAAQALHVEGQAGAVHPPVRRDTDLPARYPKPCCQHTGLSGGNHLRRLALGRHLVDVLSAGRLIAGHRHHHRRTICNHHSPPQRSFRSLAVSRRPERFPSPVVLGSLMGFLSTLGQSVLTVCAVTPRCWNKLLEDPKP